MQISYSIFAGITQWIRFGIKMDRFIQFTPPSLPPSFNVIFFGENITNVSAFSQIVYNSLIKIHSGEAKNISRSTPVTDDLNN